LPYLIHATFYVTVPTPAAITVTIATATAMMTTITTTSHTIKVPHCNGHSLQIIKFMLLEVLKAQGMPSGAMQKGLGRGRV
jgi:hypothetical protein